MTLEAPDPTERAAAAAALGHSPHLGPRQHGALARLARDDPDARVRCAALGALVRAAPARATPCWRAALDDADPSVRRRAAELAPALASGADPERLAALLADPEPLVAEAAAWALGELQARGAVGPLADAARRHPDALVREAAVAALGAIGDPAGLPAVLEACSDRPPVRRRAVLALAPFEGPEVEAAIDRALADRDWQVRQAAEDLRDAGTTS